MIIREYRTFSPDEILPLYDSVGWTSYTAHPDTLLRGFEHSLLILAAYENDSLIGILRAVGDSQTVVLIQDLLVHPAHQRKGVGSALLQNVLHRFSHIRQILLMTDDTPQTNAFYTSQGLTCLSDLGLCAFLRT